MNWPPPKNSLVGGQNGPNIVWPLMAIECSHWGVVSFHSVRHGRVANVNAGRDTAKMIIRFDRTILSLFYLGLSAISSTATAQTCNDMQFTDVTLSAGINHLYARPPTASPATPGGATVADVNGDGWMDIYAVQGDAGG